MNKKLDLLLAVCKANCNKCGNEDWLYIPEGSEYGLLCETCMNELALPIDKTETKKNMGNMYPE